MSCYDRSRNNDNVDEEGTKYHFTLLYMWLKHVQFQVLEATTTAALALALAPALNLTPWSHFASKSRYLIFCVLFRRYRYIYISNRDSLYLLCVVQECNATEIHCDAGVDSEGCWYGNYCINQVLNHPHPSLLLLFAEQFGVFLIFPWGLKCITCDQYHSKCND